MVGYRDVRTEAKAKYLKGLSIAKCKTYSSLAPAKLLLNGGACYDSKIGFVQFL